MGEISGSRYIYTYIYTGYSEGKYHFTIVVKFNVFSISMMNLYLDIKIIYAPHGLKISKEERFVQYGK